MSFILIHCLLLILGGKLFRQAPRSHSTEQKGFLSFYLGIVFDASKFLHYNYKLLCATLIDCYCYHLFHSRQYLQSFVPNIKARGIAAISRGFEKAIEVLKVIELVCNFDFI